MAGFKSDTYRLQAMGWQLSMDQDLYNSRIRLAIKHPDMGVVGLSEASDYEFLRRAQFGAHRDLPVFHISHFSSAIMVHNLRAPRVEDWNFQPVDSTPHLHLEPAKDITDLILFTPAKVQAKEIIVAEREVSAILDELLQKQQPMQGEIRDRIRREQERAIRAGLSVELQPQLYHHATILTFARKAA
jgi:hypothetical protein